MKVVAARVNNPGTTYFRTLKNPIPLKWKQTMQKIKLKKPRTKFALKSIETSIMSPDLKRNYWRKLYIVYS